MEKMEYKGIWWLPSHTDEKIEGILTIVPQSTQIKIELELIGDLMNDHYLLLNNNRKDIILGESNQEKITLLDCWDFEHKSLSKHDTYKVINRYIISTVILGDHFKTFDENFYSKIIVTFNPSTNWYNEILGEFTINDLSQFTIKLLKFNNLDSFEITANESFSIDEGYQKLIKPLRNFLKFIMNQPNTVRKILIQSEDNKYLSLIGDNMNLNEDNLLLPIHKMLLSLDELKDEFSLIMQRWFNLYQSIESVLNLYFAT